MRREDRCPKCKSPIQPTLFQYLPPRGSRKQYQCPRCGTWLTIDGRSRLIMFFVMFGVWMGLTLLMFLWLPQIRRVIPLHNLAEGMIYSAIPMLLSVLATVLLLRRCAGWVVSPKSSWDLPAWVHED